MGQRIDCEIPLSALSRLRFPIESIADTADFIFKNLYNFVKINHPQVIFYKQVILNKLFKNIQV